MAEQQTDRQTIEEALEQYKDLDTDPQLLLLERSLQKAEAAFTAIDTTTAKVYQALSDWYRNAKKFEKALAFSKKHLHSFIILDAYPLRTAEAYTLTAERYLELYNFEKAGEYFQRSLDINKGRVRAYDYKNYKGLATVLLAQGNFNIQIEHGKYAYDLAASPSEKCHALHAQFQGYARLGDIEACNSNIEEQLAISKQNQLAYCRGRAYTSLGWVHNIQAKKDFATYRSELRKFKAAKKLNSSKTSKSKSSYYKNQADTNFRQAINYYDKGVSFMKGSEHRDEMRTISWAYKNISNQYKSLGKLDLSIQYAKLAIQENRAFFDQEYYPELADFYHNLSTKYSLKAKYGGPEDYEAALRHIQNAIKCLLKDESFSDSREAIPSEQLYKVSIKWQLLTELKEKALCYAHLYINHENQEDLESADRHLANAIELIDIMRAELSTDNTKIYWRRQTRSIYNTAIEIADWLGDKDKVLKYMEKSRALLLLDELNNKDAKALIPAVLAERERDLRDAFTETQESDLVKYNAYNNFLDSLKIAYPRYYKYKFDVQIPDIAAVQKEILDDSTQILSYHITPDSLYLLNITSGDPRLLTQPRPRSLTTEVKELLHLVGNKDSLEFQHNYERFMALASQLHTTLFSGISKKRSKIIIVGDGVINYVPFEVLVSQIDDGVPRYLIEDYTISMAPSLSVLQKYNVDKDFNSLLLVSPGQFDHNNLNPLSSSDEEIEELKNISNTQVLAADKASLQNFIAICNDYDVVHFSTHSGIDKESRQPWIAFKDSLISLNEIYKLNLNASLVTLSSCKSSDGSDRSGEGINSLSRAFLFADAASVVGSMWNLNEEAGKSILVGFYHGLKDEKDKPTSLRDAKLNYINNNKYKSPYYWSSLVLMGDPSSLDAGPQTSGLGGVYLFVLLLICIVLLLGYRWLGKGKYVLL